jgi:hypothetical protein
MAGVRLHCLYESTLHKVEPPNEVEMGIDGGNTVTVPEHQ